MDDLIIVRKTKYQDDGLAFSDGNFTNLIMQQPGLEVVFDFMPKGSAGFFYVVESDKTTEFNFIMEGKLLVRDQNKSYILNAGDFFCQKGVDHFVSFEILEDTKMFYLNNRPYFDTYEKQVSGLLKVLNQLQEVDGDTLNHCNRVKALSLGIAFHVGFNQANINLLYYASRFHDVGKAKIPVEILLKPGKLTSEEFEVMKTHSYYTYEMIREYYGEEIATIAYHHHERLDGTGYPQKLKGDQIGIASRIICVADAYDAIVTSRPYHQAKSKEEALAELWRCVDTQFDGKVIQGLVDYLDEHEKLLTQD